ncbi:MAG: hypothetical protein ABIX12_06665 [Rubrivivax sp.]
MKTPREYTRPAGATRSPMAALVLALALGGCANTGTAPVRETTTEAAPAAAPCPKGGPDGARCWRGVDSAGAPYILALPAEWNRVLVVHAHGGPALGANPDPKRADADYDRWSITVKAGYAWAASVFRQGGVEVRAAAEDTERVRRIFVAHVAQPRRTLLHGQSWGAGVAAKLAEMDTARGGKPRYDGVLLTSGVLGGGTRSYDFRLDLRVVYQALCGNHPKPDEPAYPLWMGLPAASTLSRAELAARVDDCLGTAHPAAQRSPAQSERLKTLARVVRIPEGSVVAHLNWATWHFQDIALHRSGGKPVFGNERARYVGSADDAALNAQVLRYRADPEAVRRFGADTDPDGKIAVPVLTAHAIDDPTAFVELESAFRTTMQRAGTADHLVQAFTHDKVHSYLSDPVYPTLFEALVRWVDDGVKPTPAGIAARCEALVAQYGPGCRFDPGYQPPPLDARITPR